MKEVVEKKIRLESFVKHSIEAVNLGLEFAKQESLVPIATTSCGKYSALLMSILQEAKADIPVIFVDMGPACYSTTTSDYMFNFFKEKMRIDIRKHFSHLISDKRAPNKEELDRIYGRYWQNPLTDAYQIVMRELKLAPCLDAVQTEIQKNGTRGALLIRGTRMNPDIPERADIKLFGDYEFGKTLHPVADWTNEVIENYFSERAIPINQLHFDPSRGRRIANGAVEISYPDGISFPATHSVCVLDKVSENKNDPASKRW